MRQLIVKYDGQCANCGASLAIGDQAMYEKSMGIFCVGCEPKDIEEIRHYRQLKADRKADKYESWAGKREQKANAQLNSMPSVRHDWAFITQPGHIPARAQMNKADDRAYESLNKAHEMRGKAESLRHVQVKGDAERRRQAVRDRLDTLISKGSRVVDPCFGEGEVISVHKKSYRIKFDRGFTNSRDKSFIRPLNA